MKTWLLVGKAVLSPWLLLAGLAFFRGLGFSVTAKHFIALAWFCLFWSIAIAAYLGILYFVKKRRKRKGNSKTKASDIYDNTGMLLQNDGGGHSYLVLLCHKIHAIIGTSSSFT
ncbi:hypothetical protein [Ralstonia syzygii]